jgi:lipoyl(octanoyl) transferase
VPEYFCRLLPFAVADGPANMAADEVMLESAAAGVASLRIYGWSPPTLSLGYFQPEQSRLHDPRLAELPFVRRPTGGKTLVHDRELTYALALPAEPPWQHKEPGSLPWLCRMHRIIAAALQSLDVETAAVHCATEPGHSDPLCFHSLTPGDLTIGGAKVVGSAQRRLRGALLQHGAVLLATSPNTPSLPGIRETTGRAPPALALAEAIEREWTQQTGWPLTPATWSAAEGRRMKDLIQDKYGISAWNYKR